MFEKAISGVSLCGAGAGAMAKEGYPSSVGPITSSCYSVGRSSRRGRGNVWAMGGNSSGVVVFKPFEEVKKEELVIPIAPHLSLARHTFLDDCEAAINDQIK